MNLPRRIVRTLVGSILIAMLIGGINLKPFDSSTASARAYIPGPARYDPNPSQSWVNLGPTQSMTHLDAGAVGAGAAISLAAADLDADGALDLISGTSDASGSKLMIYPGNPDRNSDVPFLEGRQTIPLAHAPTWLGSGDFDADGYYDIVAGGFGCFAADLPARKRRRWFWQPAGNPAAG